ncbi:GNAT family N-acetyltransferase [Aquabacterium sp. J223]|uniref:GNAT family N-acetyltransferase n=1 Tax=Aquabacterium sp. J223 TaxID=2898431 RepID=UPI0021ADD797|nr:GNAT family N-acetyltransferase [Aquabacterium sp. J223]UUX97665.1 N-acetyltransferase family protein [Aquabacterium sp. J223]
MSHDRLVLRPAHAADGAAMAEVYRHHVEHGTGTFETVAPSADEMAARLADVQARRGVWWVAERDGGLLGYAYAQPFRPRQAYAWCFEDSVYLAPAACGQGLGRLLLAELIGQCRARGVRQLVAVIGDAANAPSIGLHRALGFAPAGVLTAAGWKHGRWLDVVLMQRSLGAGAAAAPGSAA